MKSLGIFLSQNIFQSFTLAYSGNNDLQFPSQKQKIMDKNLNLKPKFK